MKYRVEIREYEYSIQAQIWRLGRSKIFKSKGEVSKEIEIGNLSEVVDEVF